MSKMYQNRAEAIPVNAVSRYESSCFRAYIEHYHDCSGASFQLPEIPQHWLIIQNKVGPDTMGVQLNEREYRVSSLGINEVMYIPPFTKTSWEFSRVKECTHFLLPDSLFSEVAQDERDLQALYGEQEVIAKSMPEVSQVVNSLSPSLRGDQKLSNLAMADLMLRTSGAFLKHREVRALKEPLTQRNPISDQVHDRLLDFMWENLEHNISVEELAKVANLSTFHFARCFKARVKTSPHQFLMKLRIIKARTLIPQNHSLTHIAYACGFTDQAHFSRVFKRMIGLTPIAFRAETT